MSHLWFRSPLIGFLKVKHPLKQKVHGLLKQGWKAYFSDLEASKLDEFSLDVCRWL